MEFEQVPSTAKCPHTAISLSFCVLSFNKNLSTSLPITRVFEYVETSVPPYYVGNNEDEYDKDNNFDDIVTTNET